MQLSGVVPPDAPDPMEQLRARVREVGFSVFGLVPQRTVEDYGAVSLVEGRGEHGLDQQAVSVSYTLWRNPDDPDDPANLADLDPDTRASLDSEPPWPRPAWLLESVQRMRFRQLWEVVRTSWYLEDRDDWTRLERQLIAHAEHILMNRFRTELKLELGPAGDGPWRIHPSAARPATSTIDGIEVDAVAIDTDPLVYAIGARIDSQTVVTVVLPRDDLPSIDLTLQTRAEG